jgi:fission process protein 1
MSGQSARAAAPAAAPGGARRPAARPRRVAARAAPGKGRAASPSPPAAAAAGGGGGPLARLLASLDTSEPTSFDGEEKTEYDPLRDGPLRYLGYANELGEAFAAWLFPGGVPLSYGIAIAYVLFDTADKYASTRAAAQARLGVTGADGKGSGNGKGGAKVPASVNVQRLVDVIALERGVDTLAWQLIASVAAPGYTIHTVVAAARAALEAAERQPAVAAALDAAATAAGAAPEAFLDALNRGAPTAAGLAAIPFIVHPLDAGVHVLLNATLRPALRRYVCAAGGAAAGLAACEDCALPRE